jgi:hypothetical protein
MVVLRATHKVLKMMPQTASSAEASDTALGDWYVHRIVVDRKPLLLFVSSESLLAILTPARDVKTLPGRFPGIVADRLGRPAVDRDLVDAEAAAMSTVRVGRTRDRSVLGQMVDFAKAIPYYLPVDGWDASDLRATEERLGETPCRVSHEPRSGSIR